MNMKWMRLVVEHRWFALGAMLLLGVPVLSASGAIGFYPGPCFGTANTSYDLVCADFNTDGYDDVFVANDGANVLYLNDQQGGFSASSQQFPDRLSRGVACGDLDGDQDVDVVLANYEQPVAVWLNTGDGTFEEMSTPVFSNVYNTAVALVDLNDDNALDLVVGRSGERFAQKSEMFLNDGSGGFAACSEPELIAAITSDVLVHDVTGDGSVDVLLANNGNNMVLENDGHGVFSPYITESYTDDTLQLACGDLDGDTYPDVVAANRWPGPCRIYFSDPVHGGMSERSFGFDELDATGVVVAELSGDAHNDVLLCDWGGDTVLLLNDGHGTNFTRYPQSLSTNNNQRVVVADVNGDRVPDLLFANYQAPNEIWFGATGSVYVISDTHVVVPSGSEASVLKRTDFEEVMYETAQTHSFQLNNLSTNALLIESAVLLGTHANSFSQTGLTSALVLGPCSTLVFAVAYDPQSIGQETAALNISMDSESQPYVVHLAGTGVQADQTITFDPPGSQVVGVSLKLGAESSSGLPVTYDPITGPAHLVDGTTDQLEFTAAGVVSVTAVQPGNAYYSAAEPVTRSFSVALGQAHFTLYDLEQVYDGSPCVVTATTDAVGADVQLTYEGDAYPAQPSPPVNAGSYTVTASVNTPAWYGTTNSTLVIRRAPQQITAFTPSSAYWWTTDSLSLKATASSGLPVTDFKLISGAALLDGSTLSFTSSGPVVVTAEQAGDANWEAAPSCTNEYTIAKAPGSLQVLSTQAVYAAAPQPIRYATDPLSLHDAVVITYNGETQPPENVGVYETILTIDDPMYEGTTQVDYAITAAVPTVSWEVELNCLTTDKVLLNAVSSSSTGAISYAVQPGDNGVIVGNYLEFTGDGSVTVQVSQEKTPNYTAATLTKSFSVTKAEGVVFCVSTQAHVYDGQAVAVAYETEPAGMTVDWLVNGSSRMPSNAGTYIAVGTLNDQRFRADAQDVTLVISPAEQTLYVEPIAPEQVTTSAIPLTAASTSRLGVEWETAGPARLIADILSFTGDGEVVVTATALYNRNWQAAAPISQTVTVYKAVAAVVMEDASETYDGLTNKLAVSTVPTGLVVQLTYNGDIAAPVNAGSYSVTGCVQDVLYAGTNTAVLTVQQAAQQITFAEEGYVLVSNGVTLRATADSGLPVSYSIAELVPSNENSRAWITNGNELVFSITGKVVEVQVEAMQAGNENWQPAPSVTNLFVAGRELCRVELTGLNAVYDGEPNAVGWTCTNANVTNVVAYYDGAERSRTAAPVTTGVYEVWAVIEQSEYWGGGAGELVISPAAQSVYFTGWSNNAFASQELSLAATSSVPALTNMHYSVVFGPGQITGSTLTFTGSGLVQVRVEEPGNANFLSDSATKAVSVSKTPVTVTLQDVTQPYSGAPVSVPVSTEPDGVECTVLYDGLQTAPITAGVYQVIASVSDSNRYVGAASGTLEITRAPASVALYGWEHQVYDRAAHVVTASVDVAVSGYVAVRYDGESTPPVSAGTYEVTGVLVDPNYAGGATQQLVIAKADQFITNVLPVSGSEMAMFATNTCSAQADSDLAVTWTNVGGNVQLEWLDADSFAVFSGGELLLGFDQAGDENWNAAPQVVVTVRVQKVQSTYFVTTDGNDRRDGLSWATAKATLQAAADCAASGSQVWVSNGVYATGGYALDGRSLTNRLVIGPGVRVASVNGCEVTMIDGADADRCVYMADGAELQGFTLRSGSALVADGEDGQGGGCYAVGTAALADVVLHDNRARDGAGVFAAGAVQLVNALLYSNVAETVTGSVVSGWGTLCNVTLADNQLNAGACAVKGGLNEKGFVLKNCVVVSNGGFDVNGWVAAGYSCLSRLDPLQVPLLVRCITNRSPQFCDPAQQNYRLQATSPCINAGRNEAVPAGITTDLAGGPRIGFETVDVGAYEFCEEPLPVTELSATPKEWALQVQWTPQGPSGLPGYITNYLVQVTDADEKAIAGYPQSLGTQTHCMVTGISPPGAYRVSVLPQNQYGAASNAVQVDAVPLKASQTIHFSQQGAVSAVEPLQLQATADSGLAVAYQVVSFSPSNANNRCWISEDSIVHFEVTGTVSELLLTASQAGNAQWDAAVPVTNQFVVLESKVDVVVDVVNRPYDGTAHAAEWRCTNSAITNVVLYYGSYAQANTNPPVNAGVYSVSALVSQPGYFGGGSNVLCISTAAQSIVYFDAPQSAGATSTVVLRAVASSGLPVDFRVVGGPGSVSGGTNLSFSGAGQVSVMAEQPGNSNYHAVAEVKQIAVSKASAAVVLNADSLSQVYDGRSKVVDATTDPVGLSVKVTYDGDVFAMDAGLYDVEAEIDDARYAGSASATLRVERADAVLVLDDPGDQWATAQVTLSAASESPAAVVYTLESGPAELNGNVLTFSAAGMVAVSAIQDVSTNWNASHSVTQSFVVSKAHAAVQLMALEQTYDGSSKAVSVVTIPPELPVHVLYDGVAEPPVNAGRYTVTAAIDAARYTGGATGELVLARADQSLVFEPPVWWNAASNLNLEAAAESGLPVAFSIVQFEPTNAYNRCALTNGTQVVFAVTNRLSRLVVEASQAGSSNWNAVVSNHTFLVFTERDEVVFGAETTVYDGKPHAISCSSSNVAVTNIVLYYDGATMSETNPPINAGQYDVVARIEQPNCSGGGQTTQTILKADQSILSGWLPQFAHTTNVVELSAETDAGLTNVAFVVSSGPGAIAADGRTLRFSMAGMVDVLAIQAGTSNYNATAQTQRVQVIRSVASVTLDTNTLLQSYTGDPLAVRATTDPAVEAVIYLYNGVTNQPVNTGVYRVDAVVIDPVYSGATNGTLSIVQAAPQLVLENPGAQWTTNHVTLSAHSDCPLPIVYSVLDGPAVCRLDQVVFTQSGMVTLAALQSGDANWRAAVSRVEFQVSRAIAPLYISNTQQVYNTDSHAVTVTTDPSGLSVDVTYDGSTALPVHAGTYEVVAQIAADEPIYQGSATTTLTVVKGDQTIIFTNEWTVRAVDGLDLAASAASGLPVRYTISEFSPSNAQNRCWMSSDHQVAFSVTNLQSTLTIIANQDGDEQWNAAPSVTNLFYVYSVFSRVSLSELDFTYDGAPHPASWSCTNAAVSNVVLYYDGVGDAFTNPPVNAGSHVVYALIQQPDIKGGGTAVMTGARAAQTIEEFNLPERLLSTNEWALSARTSFGLTPLTFSVTNGPGQLDGTVLTFSGTGPVAVQVVQAGNSNCLAVSQSKTVMVEHTPVSSIAWVTNTLTPIYSGAACAAQAETQPAGLTLLYSYDGQTNLPVNAGTVAVQAVVSDVFYSGSLTGVQVIAKAASALSFPAPEAQAVTNVLTLSASSDSPEPVTYAVVSGPAVVEETSLSFTNIGAVVLQAVQSEGSNWLAAVSNVSFNVNKAEAQLAIGNTQQAYTGGTRPVSVTTVPVDLPVAVTYDGSTVLPVHAGTYEVVARIAAADPLYQGSATTTMTVVKGAQQIDFPNPGYVQSATGTVQLTATASSGLTVSNIYVASCVPSNTPDCCSISTSHVLRFNTTNLTMTVQVVATQSGNENWLPASPVTNQMLVYQSFTRLTIAQTNQTYTGIACPVEVINPDPQLTNIVVTYNGDEDPPVHAGTYQIEARSIQPNRAAYGVSQLHVQPAALSIVADNIRIKTGSPWPPQFTATCQGFVHGETTNVLTAPLLFDSDAYENCTPGRYVIEPYNAAADDYAITFVNGTLKVIGKDLSWLMLLLF